jgi:hypothetical protein
LEEDISSSSSSTEMEGHTTITEVRITRAAGGLGIKRGEWHSSQSEQYTASRGGRGRPEERRGKRRKEASREGQRENRRRRKKWERRTPRGHRSGDTVSGRRPGRRGRAIR